MHPFARPQRRVVVILCRALVAALLASVVPSERVTTSTVATTIERAVRE